MGDRVEDRAVLRPANWFTLIGTSRSSALGRVPMRQSECLTCMQTALHEPGREPATRTTSNFRRVLASPITCDAGRMWACGHVRECAEMDERVRTGAPVVRLRKLKFKLKLKW